MPEAVQNPPHHGWEIKLLHDGLCPICSREVRMMRRFDRHGSIAFEDIADPSFDPDRYGLTMSQVVAAMHAVLPDGRIVTGMEVFRRTYRCLGFGWLMAPTGWPVLRPVFDALYRLFARIRPRLSRFRGCETNRCAALRLP